MEKEPLANASLIGLPDSGRVVIGFSGGADSTALAHWTMAQIGRERILLAHVNHCLRGEESEGDQAFAENFARSHGLAIQVCRKDVGALARKRRQGLEECGRQVRYSFFAQLAPGEKDRVLTAHNGDDNVETILLNLCRGTGPDGLCGIPRSRGKILRPLLGVTREEIEKYCQANGLDYVTDSTNFSEDYARNRLRLQVIPVLRSLNPRVAQLAGQAAALLSQDRDYLREEALALLKRARRPAPEGWGLEAKTLLAAPEPLQSRALKLYLEQAGCSSLERRHVEAAGKVLAEGGGGDLPGGVELRCAQGLLWAGPRRPQQAFALPVVLGENPLPGGKILILQKKILPEIENHEKIQNLLFKNSLDYAIMTRTLVARNRRPGDRFSQAGRRVSKPLKQVFQELRIPAPLRGQAVLLECEGKIVWCQGAGAAQGFQPRKGGAAVLTVEIRSQAPPAGAPRLGRDEGLE